MHRASGIVWQSRALHNHGGQETGGCCGKVGGENIPPPQVHSGSASTSSNEAPTSCSLPPSDFLLLQIQGIKPLIMIEPSNPSGKPNQHQDIEGLYVIFKLKIPCTCYILVCTCHDVKVRGQLLGGQVSSSTKWVLEGHTWVARLGGKCY